MNYLIGTGSPLFGKLIDEYVCFREEDGATM